MVSTEPTVYSTLVKPTTPPPPLPPPPHKQTQHPPPHNPQTNTTPPPPPQPTTPLTVHKCCLCTQMLEVWRRRRRWRSRRIKSQSEDPWFHLWGPWVIINPTSSLTLFVHAVYNHQKCNIICYQIIWTLIIYKIILKGYFIIKLLFEYKLFICFFYW